MAKSLDVAVEFLKQSIEKGRQNPDYLMNSVKLHKLMYLGQCFIKYSYGMELFEEEITAEDDGPYVNGIGLVPGKCGFDNIHNIDVLKKYVLDLPISFSRMETVELILDIYGKYSVDEIVNITKNTTAWQISYNKSDSKTRTIEHELITETGEELFKDIIKPFGIPENEMSTCPKKRKKTL